MNHFRHPLCNGSLFGDYGVSTLPVQWGTMEGADCVRSFWNPTPDELLAINQGGPIVLTFLGHSHPPLRMDALNPEHGLDTEFKHDEALLNELCEEALQRFGPHRTREEMFDIAKTYALQMLRRYGK